MSSQPDNDSPKFGHTLFTGLLVTAIVLLGKWCIEHHPLYEGLQRSSYSWLQSRLRPPISREDLPVVVVDIHELDTIEKENNGRKFSVTPRKELLELITKVADQQPRAIGVDIDFSPDRFGYLDPENDQVFFRNLMEISKNKVVPIFLGIRRSQNKPPEKWLGASEFASLAATIMIPPNDYRKMLKWVQATDNVGNESPRGQSMSAALAQTFMKRRIDSSSGWIVTLDSQEEIEPGLKAAEFLVDFSPLKLMMDLRLTTRNTSTISDLGWTLRNKVVLIGDGETTDTRDTFRVPNPEHPDGVPGIFKHAAGVYTLIKAPLYEMTPLGRIAVDLALSLMVLVPLALARRLVSSRSGSRLADHSAMAFFTVVAAVVLLVVGVVFVHLTRVMWDDFLFVILALWLHRPIATIIHLCWVGLKKLPKLFTSTFSKVERRETS